MFLNIFGCTVVLSLISSITFAQISNNLDFDDLNKQLHNESSIDGLLEQNGINRTQFDPEKIENRFRAECEKQNASDAVDILKNEQNIIKECVERKFNVTQLQAELEKAKETGSMDEVFAKYCARWPEFQDCFENATETAKRCMSDKVKKSFNKTMDIVQEVQQFMCHKDGDRLAMFVAEGGVECMEEQQEGVKACFNSTFAGRFPQDEAAFSSMPFMLFNDNDCNDFDTLRLCVNEVLERCKDTTPANIVDASFKFIKKQISCGEIKNDAVLGSRKEPEQQSSAYPLVSSLFMLGLSCILILNTSW